MGHLWDKRNIIQVQLGIFQVVGCTPSHDVNGPSVSHSNTSGIAILFELV